MTPPGGGASTSAYRHCESLTRAAAANFYYGIRLLPAEKRRAMCAVYAFARRIDDIGDGSLPDGEKLRLLDAASEALREDPPPSASDDPVIVALVDARIRFGLPGDALSDLIDGVRMDVEGATYETFEDLLLYCRRVAGSIGRLCLAIFGVDDCQVAAALADDLGVAMQLTNILRDLREDAQRGRVYLPAEDLRRFSWPGPDGGDAAAIAAVTPSAPGSLVDLVHFEAARNREWFERGSRLFALLDRRSGACAQAMSQIYVELLERIDARPERILEGRVRLSAAAKTRVAARSLLRR
jgi:phytoene synthase